MHSEAKYLRDNIIANIIGLQNGIGDRKDSEEYKAYQKVLELIEKNYGPMMS